LALSSSRPSPPQLHSRDKPIMQPNAPRPRGIRSRNSAPNRTVPQRRGGRTSPPRHPTGTDEGSAVLHARVLRFRRERPEAGGGSRSGEEEQWDTAGCGLGFFGAFHPAPHFSWRLDESCRYGTRAHRTRHNNGGVPQTRLVLSTVKQVARV
jgi:hypothetical protein